MSARANRSRRQCYNVTLALVQPVARRTRRQKVERIGWISLVLHSGLRSLAPRSRPRTCNMSEQRPRVVAVGEALIEFVRGGDGRFGIGCAGDTFNVAVYVARAGIDAAFATALGDDPYSEAILALAVAEGVASDLVLRTRGRLPEGLTKAKLVYFSGITLSLYSNTGLGRFLALVEMVRQQGVKVAFDGNFRPRGWRGDLSRTRT